MVSPDAVPTAYANGELDAFDIGLDPNGFQIANTTPGGTVRAAAGPNWRHITFNTTAGLIADQTIRQAIVRSLDRADIGASDLAGIPWPAKPLNNHIFVENQAGYVDNAGDFAFDPDRAMSDLDAAGWVAGSDGIREKDGQRLTVNFSQLVGVPVSENEARLVQSQLAEVGIEVNIVDVPVEDFSNVLDRRRLPADRLHLDRHAVPVRGSSRSSATAPTATSRTRTSPGSTSSSTRSARRSTSPSAPRSPTRPT